THDYRKSVRAAPRHVLEDVLPADFHQLVLALAGALEPALEALDSATGVDELLLARVEGMARRADLDVQLGLRRPGDELVAARAANGRKDVIGMNLSFHRLRPR